jgi:hypothetical protein
VPPPRFPAARVNIVARTLLIYVCSRVVTLFAAGITRLDHPGSTLYDVLGTWDGKWYVAAAARGYPHALPHHLRGVAAQSTIAFFPAYPYVMRATSRVTGLAPQAAGVVVSLVAGAIGALAIGAIARRVLDRESADRAVTLFCFFPGAFILSMVYAEALMIAAAAVCLLALLYRRWEVAGIAAAAATATRANGLVLVLCCAWAAAIAVRRHREWHALVAPILAPMGAFAYFLFLHNRTGSWTAWLAVERRGWRERIDFGAKNFAHFRHFLAAPLHSQNNLVLGLGAIFVVATAIALVRAKAPGVLVIYALGTIATVAGSATLGIRPRFVLTAFPLLFPVARWRGSAYVTALAVSGALMVLLIVFYAAQPAVAP